VKVFSARRCSWVTRRWIQLLVCARPIAVERNGTKASRDSVLLLDSPSRRYLEGLHLFVFVAVVGDCAFPCYILFYIFYFWWIISKASQALYTFFSRLSTTIVTAHLKFHTSYLDTLCAKQSKSLTLLSPLTGSFFFFFFFFKHSHKHMTFPFFILPIIKTSFLVTAPQSYY